MANKFYSPDEQRAAKVNDLFTAVARRYDLMNDLQSFGLHRLWKRRVVQLAEVRPGGKALDVCCGTGDITLALAREGMEAVGLDFTGAMLEVAEDRKKRRNSKTNGSAADPREAPVVFVRGDAQAIPFPDDSFEVVTVGYGLRNLADWRAGLAEMRRVAGPGGRILVLEFGKPDNRLWRSIYFAYLRLFIPLLGLIFCGNAAAYAYILESLKHYPAQQGVAEQMRRLGLERVGIISLLGGVMTINRGQKPEAGPKRG